MKGSHEARRTLCPIVHQCLLVQSIIRCSDDSPCQNVWENYVSHAWRFDVEMTHVLRPKGEALLTILHNQWFSKDARVHRLSPRSNVNFPVFVTEPWSPLSGRPCIFSCSDKVSTNMFLSNESYHCPFSCPNCEFSSSKGVHSRTRHCSRNNASAQK
jgi:hypothetical protein